jgi:HlyD family secretion protein
MTERGRGRWRRRAGWALLALLLAVLSAVILAPAPVPVEVGVTALGRLEVTVEEDGRAEVRARHRVSATQAGLLERPSLREGDRVSAGDVVARITPLDPALVDARRGLELRADLDRARAALDAAHDEVGRREAEARSSARRLERRRSLRAREVLADEALELAETEATVAAFSHRAARSAELEAAARVEAARAALAPRPGRAEDVVELRAPIDGVVLRRHVDTEGPVLPGAPLLDLGDPADLEVVVDVLSEDAVRLVPGAPVRLERWGGRPFAGRVRRIEPAAVTRVSALGVEEQRVDVRIDPEGDPEGWARLGDGYRVEARIVVRVVEGALIAPASAVFRHGEGWAVFAVEGERARHVEVEVGARTPREVEITGGLALDARVVLHPGERVRDGARVRAR